MASEKGLIISRFTGGLLGITAIGRDKLLTLIPKHSFHRYLLGNQCHYQLDLTQNFTLYRQVFVPGALIPLTSAM